VLYTPDISREEKMGAADVPGPDDEESTRYEATSMSDAIALDVPVGLFERAPTAFAGE